MFVTIIRMTIYKPKLKAQLVYNRIITVLLSRASCFEALAAIYGSVAGRLESKLRLAAALATCSDEVLALASFSILFLVAASLAALGLILETLFCVESLFISGENEFNTAVLTSESFVVVHLNTPNLKSVSALLRSTNDNYISTDLLCQ